MAKNTYCVCGSKITRKYNKGSKKAATGRKSGRIQRLLGTTTQLCSSCMKEFIHSRPNHDNPSSGGTFTQCDFCNDTMERGYLKAFWQWMTTPTISRWIGEVHPRKGNIQTVCTGCRSELHEFVKEKKNE